MSDWRLRDSVTELESAWLDAGYDVLDTPEGQTARYYWSRPGDGVSVVAITDAGDVVMVDEYRPRRQATERKLPTGGVDPEESFARAGRRELAEETGYRAGTVTTLQTYTPSAFERRTRGVVYATDLTSGPADPEDGEQIDVVEVPVETALETARDTGDAWTLLPLLVAIDDEDL